jgi:hypothetical protein
MKTIAELEKDIRELLVLNNRDINIGNYPDLVKSAAELGLDMSALAVKVNDVYRKTNWQPYNRIDDQLSASPSIAKGVCYEKDVKEIVDSVKSDLSEPQIISYIISIISNEPYNFQPRELTPPDWSSFRNFWMNEPAWNRYLQQVEPVFWCDEKATTMEQLGEICFRRKDDTMEYIENKFYLPPIITLLTRNVARTKSFERIFEEERDMEKRYLTIIYRLNNGLPFRFRGSMYNTVSALLDDACNSGEAFQQLETIYRKGNIHIWLKEVNADAAVHLTESTDRNGLLTFLYRINDQYPYYLNGEKYSSPASLIDAAKRTGVIWPEIFSDMNNKHIHTWFAGLNNHHWNDHLDSSIDVMMNTGIHSEEEGKLAAVQTLINLVDNTLPLPAVEVKPVSLSFLNTEASKPVEEIIQLKLSNHGFVKMKVRLEPALEGVSVDKDYLKFYSLVDNHSNEIRLRIQPMQLVKERKYDLRIVVTSIYEEISIPVEISVVFPKKAYILELLKFGCIGALFFPLVRSIVPGVNEYPYSYPALLPFNFPFSEIAEFSFLCLFAFLVLMGGLIFSYSFIKQKYKTNVNV